MKPLILTAKDHEKVSKAAAIITDALHLHFTIAAIAKQIDMPEKRLKYAFKQIHGSGLYTFLRNKRMEKAKALMLEGERIRTILPKVGYSNEGNFGKAFRKVCDELPTAWRKRQLRKAG